LSFVAMAAAVAFQEVNNIIRCLLEDRCPP
jgi:hypothetical protein